MGSDSVVEHVLSMCETPGSIPSIKPQKSSDHTRSTLVSELISLSREQAFYKSGFAAKAGLVRLTHMLINVIRPLQFEV